MPDTALIAAELLAAAKNAVESRMEAIGAVIDGEARRIAIADKIRDTGAYQDNIGHAVKWYGRTCVCHVGSNVKYEQYIEAGKVPSWTPIAPLEAWVARKGLSWTADSGKPLTKKQMAYLIRGKIKREGVPAKNVFARAIEHKTGQITEIFNRPLELTL